jgi:hypothetical protein
MVIPTKLHTTIPALGQRCKVAYLPRWFAAIEDPLIGHTINREREGVT